MSKGCKMLTKGAQCSLGTAMKVEKGAVDCPECDTGRYADKLGSRVCEASPRGIQLTLLSLTVLTISRRTKLRLGLGIVVKPTHTLRARSSTRRISASTLCCRRCPLRTLQHGNLFVVKITTKKYKTPGNFLALRPVLPSDKHATCLVLKTVTQHPDNLET